MIRLSALGMRGVSSGDWTVTGDLKKYTEALTSSTKKGVLQLWDEVTEQINHLWGSLGGRQIPFAMYKVRLVSITERTVRREVPLIEEIETNLHPTTKKP